MVLFSMTGQLIEMALYRGGFFLVEKTYNLTYWFGSFIYTRHNPELTEIELLQIEMNDLKREIKDLKIENKKCS